MKNTKKIHSLQFKTVVKDMESLGAFAFLQSLPLTSWIRHLTKEQSQKLKAAAWTTPAQLVPNHEEVYIL